MSVTRHGDSRGEYRFACLACRTLLDLSDDLEGELGTRCKRLGSSSANSRSSDDLKKAESLANILASAEVVKSSKTLDNGYHEIERARANDGFTFIALFGKDWYIKCVAPAAKIEVCREIVRSKA